MLAQDLALQSDPAFNVHVASFELHDRPARVRFDVHVGEMQFFSEITYHSIDSWDALRSRYSSALMPRLLGLIAAWDCMRFLALGGETLTLCAGLECDSKVGAIWSMCFKSQFGEWRYRNRIEYPEASYPHLHAKAPEGAGPAVAAAPAAHWLLTNGGGKDTLASLMMLSTLDVPFDFYEGCLPIGGTHDRQDELLSRLRTAAVGPEAEVLKVTVRDNFAECDDAVIERAGVKAQHYKTDFAVGHTANYVGYFPVILHHGYTQLWFNIEKSADDTMVTWNGEAINHQWCKSTEYHQISLGLFRHVCGQSWFEGFSSPLHGLYDTTIYKVVAQRQDLLQATHSCNYGKPWCGHCTKCLFCYLMMSAYVDEPYARKVLGAKRSLFSAPDLLPAWEELLSPKKVAWECVPSHAECQLAARVCLSNGADHAVLHRFAASKEDAGRLWVQFSAIDWERVPAILSAPLRRLLSQSRIPLVLDALVIGAGQAGLSASYHLQERGLAHVALEAGHVGQAWRTRWDSFALNTPNKYTHLPGMTYDGPDPDGFAGKTEVAAFFETYVAKFRLPVQVQCPVLEARKVGLDYEVSTPQGIWRARSLVVSSGHYARPYFPAAAARLPASLKVLHSSTYRNAAELPPGPVLVVGGGQSGAQIAEDLNESGRKVYWSISDRPCNYRRYRGEDFMHWWEVGGIQHRAIEDHPSIVAGEPDAKRKLRRADFPLVSGKGKEGRGHSISYKAMWESGVILAGRFESASHDHVGFRSDLIQNVEAANRATRNIRAELDQIASQFGAVAASDIEDFVAGIDSDWVPPEFLTQLALRDEQLGSIVFATGFEHGWPWLKVDRIADEMGYPLGDHGIHPIPGLYFLGLFNQQRLSSICLCNGGRDAAPVAADLSAYLDQRERVARALPAATKHSDPQKMSVLVLGGSERAQSHFSTLSRSEMNFLNFPFDADPADPAALLAAARECTLFARAAGVGAVYATGPVHALVGAAVCDALGLHGPSVESVVLSSRFSDFDNQEETLAAFFNRYLDTIKHAAIGAEGFTARRPSTAPIPITVLGWCDKAGSASAWRVTAAPQFADRDVVIDAARATAMSMGIRSSFWEARADPTSPSIVTGFQACSPDGEDDDTHLARAALALACGHGSETAALASVIRNEATVSLARRPASGENFGRARP